MILISEKVADNWYRLTRLNKPIFIYLNMISLSVYGDKCNSLNKISIIYGELKQTKLIKLKSKTQ